jgi:TatD DNase family protein
MFIDTHCHLDFKDFDNDRDAVIARSKENGIECIINVGSSLEGTRRSIELAEKNDFIYAAAGIHPHEADSVKKEDIDSFFKLLDCPKIVAIGEIGLDYYKNISSQASQKKLLIELTSRTKQKNLPLIIHNREAENDILPILKDIMGATFKGVMHCFSGDEAFLKKCLDIGLYISFTCNITFKNADRIRYIAKLVPMDRLLLETDAPFLAPQEFRGRRNEPMHVKYAAMEIARLKNIAVDEIGRITTDNARRLFKL